MSHHVAKDEREQEVRFVLTAFDRTGSFRRKQMITAYPP